MAKGINFALENTDNVQRGIEKEFRITPLRRAVIKGKKIIRERITKMRKIRRIADEVRKSWQMSSRLICENRRNLPASALV